MEKRNGKSIEHTQLLGSGHLSFVMTTRQPSRSGARRRGRIENEQILHAESVWEYAEKEKEAEGAWFPIMLGVFVIAMVILGLLVSTSSPQSRQHKWLSLNDDNKKENTNSPLSPLAQAQRSQINMVACQTTAGPLEIEVHKDWAPLGAERFLTMVVSGFFDTRVALFRAVENFICQTGISGDPKVHRKYEAIADDVQWLDLTKPQPMKRGYLSFAGSGQNSRTTEFFFAFRDLQLGNAPWEVPFAQIIGEESFLTMDRFYVGYGDIPDFGGNAPLQGRMYEEGIAYLEGNFPHLDYIEHCYIRPPNGISSVEDGSQ
uniref:PPIase cyclophilin-type domain-containing protein n=1 Tax=Aureoumbra lagunensis TaxID=44058 RepID=A0A7S3NN29_9STRA|mmetsp:Transcript_11067/g.15250  ORF Transcript_11067/g.15250 Transcript_11067/m.15250 type:complete len:317 (-) Transcript_11067:97-1047(-)